MSVEWIDTHMLKRAARLVAEIVRRRLHPTAQRKRSENRH